MDEEFRANLEACYPSGVQMIEEGIFQLMCCGAA
jgi:hypothetical protein